MGGISGVTDHRAAPITRRRFAQVVRDYRPLPVEAFSPTDSRFRGPVHHLLRNRDRFWLALRVASHFLPTRPFSVVDLGVYPGTLLRVLRRLLPPERCRLIGAGLITSEEFRRTMAADCGADIFTVNLDPKNEPLRGKGYPTRIPLDDGCADFVFALEIVEHMVSPSHLFGEAFRVLAPGGHLLVTTPNVTRIGNALKLLAGRSNFDRLIPLDYEHPDDEWRPHFREYTIEEVGDLFGRAGFTVAARRHAIAEDTRYGVRSVRQRIYDLAKLPFFLVPHLRGSLVVVGQKPRGGGDAGRGAGAASC